MGSPPYDLVARMDGALRPLGVSPVTVPFSPQSMVGSGSWQRVNAQTAVRSPRYAVFDLAEGKPYVFRVLSANKHGLSEPSEITPPIQAQETIGECYHERPGLQWALSETHRVPRTV